MARKNELFAERVRLEAQSAAQSSGSVEMTQELGQMVRTKLSAAWDDAILSLGPKERSRLDKLITNRTRRSLGERLWSSSMDEDPFADSDSLLSLIEAEHEVLIENAAALDGIEPEYIMTPDGEDEVWRTESGVYVSFSVVQEAPEQFRTSVNQILESHNFAFRLTESSQLVPVTSHELHAAIVAPTLYLLHDQAKFAGAESAYEKALQEIRNGDAGDAITDAGTALQAALTALGCKGATLGSLLASARERGLLRGNDTPLAEAIAKAASWVAAKRNDGEAHNADADTELHDAWMVVHVVGALIVRLVEAGRAG